MLGPFRISPRKRPTVTNQEVEEVKAHFDKVAQGIRTDFREDLRGEITAVREDLRGEITAVRDDLRGEIAGVQSRADTVAQEIRSEMRQEFAKVRDDIVEFRRDSAAVADHLKEEIAEVRHYTGAVAEDLCSEIRTVAEGVALANARIDDVDLRVDGLTSEVRRGFAGVRAEIHRLHETDDELRRRIEAQEQRGA